MTSQTIRNPQFEQNDIGRYLCELEQIEPSVIAHLDLIIEQPTTQLRSKFLSTFLAAFEQTLENMVNNDEHL